MYSDEIAREFFDTMLKREHSPTDRRKLTISKGEMGILVYLVNHKDGANVGELTDYLQVTSGRTASILKTLEKKGLVVRRTDSSDNRRICVFITDSGRARFQAEYNSAVALLSELLERLGEDDAREYVRLMKKATLC